MSTDPKKYHLDFNAAYGPVTGDYNQVTQYFVAGDSAAPPLDLDRLRLAVYRAGAPLRDVPAGTGGRHLARPEVDQILDWRQAVGL